MNNEYADREYLFDAGKGSAAPFASGPATVGADYPAVFAISAPGFLSWGNLSSPVLNNFVLLAIVAIGMTGLLLLVVLICRWERHWTLPASVSWSR